MKKVGKIERLCCANCAARMQEKISKIDGVNEVNIGFITQKIMLDIDDVRSDAIVEKVRKVILSVEPDCNLVF